MEGNVAPFGGYLTFCEATPHEYLHRVDNHNRIFGDDARVIGVTKAAGQIGFAVSQRAIQGKEPSWNEVKRFMQDAGFRQVKAAGIDNTHMADKTWYRPDPGYVVSDVKPDNFKKDATGRVIPFDLNVQRAEPGSDLRTAVEFNL